MSTVITHLMTASEFAQLPEGSTHRELVRGEIIETMAPGGEHGTIAGDTYSYLRAWSRPQGGYVGVEVGYILARDPDTVRIPDVSYVRPTRIPKTGVPKTYWQLAPDLAVEVVSPSETANEVQDKVTDYLASGTSMVWVIYPRFQHVIVHTPDGVARTYDRNATLHFPELLPGFSCTVAELFEL